MRTLSTLQRGVEQPSPLSIFRPDDFSTRPQLTSPCDTVPRNDKSCFSGCHSCCVLAIVLLRVLDGQTISLDGIIRMGDFPVAKKPPLILGEEAAGIVDRNGAGFKAGERVIVYGGGLGVFRDGTWAEAVAVRLSASLISWRINSYGRALALKARRISRCSDSAGPHCAPGHPGATQDQASGFA